jgi:hypothetical protein
MPQLSLLSQTFLMQTHQQTGDRIFVMNEPDVGGALLEVLFAPFY